MKQDPWASYGQIWLLEQTHYQLFDTVYKEIVEFIGHSLTIRFSRTISRFNSVILLDVWAFVRIFQILFGFSLLLSIDS